MAVLDTDSALLYQAGEISYPQWCADAERENVELLLILRETLTESRLRLEPPGMLSQRLPQFRPHVLLLFGEMRQWRWLAPYLPVVVVPDLNNMRTVQAAGHLSDIARRGWLAVTIHNGALTLRKNQDD